MSNEINLVSTRNKELNMIIGNDNTAQKEDVLQWTWGNDDLVALVLPHEVPVMIRCGRAVPIIQIA